MKLERRTGDLCRRRNVSVYRARLGATVKTHLDMSSSSNVLVGSISSPSRNTGNVATHRGISSSVLTFGQCRIILQTVKGTRE